MSQQGNVTTLDANVLIDEYKTLMSNIMDDYLKQKTMNRQIQKQFQAEISRLQNEIQHLRQMQEASMANNSLIDIETPA